MSRVAALLIQEWHLQQWLLFPLKSFIKIVHGTAEIPKTEPLQGSTRLLHLLPPRTPAWRQAWGGHLMTNLSGNPAPHLLWNLGAARVMGSGWLSFRRLTQTVTFKALPLCVILKI